MGRIRSRIIVQAQTAIRFKSRTLAPIISDTVFINREIFMPCSRRTLLSTFSVLLLSGCGFHLRGSFTLPFKTLFLDMDGNSKFTATLARMLRAGSNVSLVETIQDAQAVLRITQNTSSRDVLSYSTSGRAREFELKIVLTFTVVAPDGHVFLAPTTISVARDITYDDNDYLSRDSEETMIKTEMQNDIIEQMIRRIERATPER